MGTCFSRQGTIAVGLARPKTTLIFFDSILCPQIKYILPSLDDASYFFKIPRDFITGFSDLGIHDNANDFVATRLAGIAGKNFGDDYIRLQNSSQYERETFIKRVKADFEDGFYTLDWIYEDKDLLDEYFLLTSMLVNSSQKNFSITPVFRNEEQYWRVDDRKRVSDFLNDVSPKMNIERINETKPAVGVSFSGNLSIDEDSLEWEQVKEFRDDKHSIRKARLHNWFQRLEFRDKAEFENQIHLAFHDYEVALKKHGVHCKIGGLSTILIASSAVYSLFSQSKLGIVLGGMALATTATMFAVDSFLGHKTLHDAPIAFLHDVIKNKK